MCAFKLQGATVSATRVIVEQRLPRKLGATQITDVVSSMEMNLRHMQFEVDQRAVYFSANLAAHSRLAHALKQVRQRRN